jgi:hypothetical protein
MMSLPVRLYNDTQRQYFFCIQMSMFWISYSPNLLVPKNVDVMKSRIQYCRFNEMPQIREKLVYAVNENFTKTIISPQVMSN